MPGHTHDVLCAVISNIMLDEPSKLSCRGRSTTRTREAPSIETLYLYSSVVWSLRPSRLQALHNIVLGSDHLFRYPTHTIGTVANVVDLRGRSSTNIASSTPDAASIGTAITVLEPRRWCKVERSERARFPKLVTMTC